VLSQMKANLEGRIGKDTKYPSRSTRATLSEVSALHRPCRIETAEWTYPGGVSEIPKTVRALPNALKAQVLEVWKIRAEGKPWDEAPPVRKARKPANPCDGRDAEQREL